MNVKVQRILEEYFEKRENFPEEVSGGLEYAFTVLDSEGGGVLGMVGRVGRKRGNRLLSHALAPHTPASTLKPLALYAPLIDEGKISWSTVLDDIPLEFRGSEGGSRPYPRNSPAVYDGLLTVKDSLRLSKNTAALRLLKMRGIDSTFNALRDDFGFTTLVRRREANGEIYSDLGSAPLAFGQLTDGVSLLKLTEAYTAFPSEGRLSTAATYLYVKDYKGELILEKEKESRRVFAPETARIMNQLLSEVVKSGTAGRITLKNTINTAGKTGTSSGDRDRLFIGYTPYYTAGIWCGYESGKSLGTLSVSHLKIWDEIMTKIHEATVREEHKRSFSTEGLKRMGYCRDSGELYCERCIYDVRGDRLEYGYFTRDNCPTLPCSRHITVDFCTEGKGIAHRGCDREDIARISLIKVERSFPEEVYITDAEFVYRDGLAEPIGSDESKPYFYPSLPVGEYSGVSGDKKQFNRFCQKHR